MGFKFELFSASAKKAIADAYDRFAMKKRAKKYK